MNFSSISFHQMFQLHYSFGHRCRQMIKESGYALTELNFYQSLFQTYSLKIVSAIITKSELWAFSANKKKNDTIVIIYHL